MDGSCRLTLDYRDSRYCTRSFCCRRRQPQVERGVVVLDHGEQVREPAVVVEAALLVASTGRPAGWSGTCGSASGRPGSCRCRSRWPVCRFQPGSVNSRRHVAGRALGLAVEQRLAARGRHRVERALRRRRRRQRELVGLQRRAASGVTRSTGAVTCPKPVLAPRSGTASALSSRGSKNVPWPCISRIATNAFQYGDRAPAGPGVQVDARPDRTPAGSASPPSCRRAGTPCRPGTARRRTCPVPSASSTLCTVATSVCSSVGDRLQVRRQRRRSRRR